MLCWSLRTSQINRNYTSIPLLLEPPGPPHTPLHPSVLSHTVTSSEEAVETGQETEKPFSQRKYL